MDVWWFPIISRLYRFNSSSNWFPRMFRVPGWSHKLFQLSGTHPCPKLLPTRAMNFHGHHRYRLWGYRTTGGVKYRRWVRTGTELRIGDENLQRNVEKFEIHIFSQQILCCHQNPPNPNMWKAGEKLWMIYPDSINRIIQRSEFVGCILVPHCTMPVK